MASSPALLAIVAVATVVIALSHRASVSIRPQTDQSASLIALARGVRLEPSPSGRVFQQPIPAVQPHPPALSAQPTTPTPADVPRHSAAGPSVFPNVYRCPAKSSNLTDASGAPTSDAWRHALSQSAEDRACYYKAFQNCSGPSGPYRGVFVEMGALDGSYFSNTMFYERVLDWRGVLIEANPEMCAGLRKNRPLSATFCTAACSEKEGIEFITGKGPMGVAVSQNQESSVRDWFPNAATVRVRCTPLMDILNSVGLRRIDVFFLDVEGSELSVLHEFDWSIPVRVWVVELDEERDKYGEIVGLMKAHGYDIAEWTTMQFCSPGQDCARNTVFIDRSAACSPTTSFDAMHDLSMCEKLDPA